MKGKFIGIVFLTKVPSLDERAAILRIRGDVTGKNIEPWWWPGSCQLSSKGEMIAEEPAFFSLRRLVGEQFGDLFESEFSRVWTRGLSQKITTQSYGNVEVPIYGATIHTNAIKDIRLGWDSGGLRFLPESGAAGILDLEKNFNKKEGVRDRTVTAMFAQDIEAVKLAFEKL